jgi:hypothetical protein
MPGIVALGCLFALSCVTMFILWYWTQPYRTPPVPRRDESFVLLEGQTILGVIQKRNKAISEKESPYSGFGTGLITMSY